MATTVYIPKDVLAEVDRRAKHLKISRNRFVVQALERALREQQAWSPEFLRAVENLEPIAGVDELMHEIRARRTRKHPPKL